MNLKTFLKGGVISMISVFLTLGGIYLLKFNFVDAKTGTALEQQALFAKETATSSGSFFPSADYLATGNPWYFVDDYQSWPSSSTFKENDTLRLLLTLTVKLFTSTSGNCGDYNKDFVDINGDGLVDLLYFRGCSGDVFDWRPELYAVLTNNGDNTFTTAYKCAKHLDDSTNPAILTYYGDCAAL